MAKKYNCEKNGIPYFRKTKTIGHDINGNPVKKEFYGDGEKDCDEKIKEYMQELEKGINMDTQKLTVEVAMYQWLFDVLLPSNDIKSSSFEKHEANYRNYIKGSKIGCIHILNAVPRPFQLYYNDLYKNGTNILDLKTEKMKHIDVSSNKILDINKTLRAFFNYCIEQKYTSENPCTLKKIKIPGNADGLEDESELEGEDIQAFNDSELKIIKENCKYIKGKDNTFNVMVFFSLITGLRSGELRAVKRKFVSKFLVKVRNTLKNVKVFDSSTNYHRELRLIKPKSKTSIRNVDFPENFWIILEDYFKEQEEKWKRNGLEFNDDSLIFTTESCKPIDNKNFTRAWGRFLNRIGIDYKKPHAMRDTYATNLISKGAKIHTVKDLLGHSSITITEKYYIYVFPENKSETANLLNDFISV